MSQITGLPIKAPLKKQVISRPEIEKYLTQNLHEEMTPEEIHAQEALVRAFGLVSRDFNLEKFLISFYTEQAAGFYDPKRKTMFIADWIPAETQSHGAFPRTHPRVTGSKLGPGNLSPRRPRR